MRALIFGVGRMGTTIAYAMDKLGFSVVGVDANKDAAKNIPTGSENSFLAIEGEGDFKKCLETTSPDIVISSLPYHQTEPLAKTCIDLGVRYCDLGGRVDVSSRINKYALENASKPVMTDLGLAPGWVNILAEEGCRRVHGPVDQIKMMVGGLPAIPSNPPLNYAVTWSIDGLINEYRDDCEVLVNGSVEIVKGMEGLEKVEFGLLEGEELEAFYTSGGAAHTIDTMKSRGVKNCAYKTIRYKGHRDTGRFLIRNADVTDECLESVFKQGCCKSTGDVVLIKCEVLSGNLKWNKEIIVGYDNKFSAMQKSTAFSISSVAALMAEGCFDDRKVQNRGGDIKLPIVLNYKDVPYDSFVKNLEKLNLNID